MLNVIDFRLEHKCQLYVVQDFSSLINKMSLWLCNTLSSFKPVLSFFGLFAGVQSGFREKGDNDLLYLLSHEILTIPLQISQKKERTENEDNVLHNHYQGDHYLSNTAKTNYLHSFAHYRLSLNVSLSYTPLLCFKT